MLRSTSAHIDFAPLRRIYLRVRVRILFVVYLPSAIPRAWIRSITLLHQHRVCMFACACFYLHANNLEYAFWMHNIPLDSAMVQEKKSFLCYSSLNLVDLFRPQLLLHERLSGKLRKNITTRTIGHKHINSRKQAHDVALLLARSSATRCTSRDFRPANVIETRVHVKQVQALTQAPLGLQENRSTNKRRRRRRREKNSRFFASRSSTIGCTNVVYSSSSSVSKLFFRKLRCAGSCDSESSMQEPVQKIRRIHQCLDACMEHQRCKQKKFLEPRGSGKTNAQSASTQARAHTMVLYSASRRANERRRLQELSGISDTESGKSNYNSRHTSSSCNCIPKPCSWNPEVQRHDDIRYAHMSAASVITMKVHHMQKRKNVNRTRIHMGYIASTVPPLGSELRRWWSVRTGVTKQTVGKLQHAREASGERERAPASEIRYHATANYRRDTSHHVSSDKLLHIKRYETIYILCHGHFRTDLIFKLFLEASQVHSSPRRGLTKLAIDGAQHSHDEVRSENHTDKRAPDAGAKAQQERMMAPEARTTLTR
ncbi:unnamed protein product [Trichogramma brassicae]|uniref:Uncharacterized protein n=1 Tax=Trichogramma brassicae TaxID=86971 RepID=A0A6H5IFD1_9HYME|nr:unnamed protein product [Trichogramma brassicae]